ncbi:hypothetical protein [Shinella sp. BYT-45]|uniref:hypothetical protein n=1 Tax=Shinella sp. BYT-45 TaxID=3377377 RepID=UPI00398118FA
MPDGKGGTLAGLAYLGCAALAGFSPAHANDCSPAPTTVTGQMRIVETRHPDGTPIRAFVVFIEGGACVSIEGVDGEPEDVVLRDVHLAPKDGEAAGWSEVVGKEVTMQGRLGLPFTAWHVGSSMMFDATIAAVHASSDE